MSVLSYVLKTDWKTIKADWGEWRRLRSVVAKLRDTLDSDKLRITRDFGIVDSTRDIVCGPRTPACIRTARIWADNPDYDFSNKLLMFGVSDTCEQFADGTGRPRRCQNYNCKLVWPNHQYFNTLDKYNAERKRTKDFWDTRTRGPNTK